jgi:hypothetical protein
MTMLARIITSTRDPERLSIRAYDGVGCGATFQAELGKAGFKDGDIVELKVVKRKVAERHHGDSVDIVWCTPGRHEPMTSSFES